MRYHSVEPITRSEAEAVFATGQPERILYALLSVVYHDPDWRWAQSLCLGYAHHANTDLRGLAITCLGHLARIHGVLNRELVLPVLCAALSDWEWAVRGKAGDAFDDIGMYLDEAWKCGGESSIDTSPRTLLQ